jgi:ADP-ribosylglycohydrolase
MVKITRIQSIFTALAVGDAVGMPTEFTTRASIKKQYPSLVPGLIDTSFSQNHSNLAFASVTDDTEQNLYLYRLYREAGRVDAAQTAHCLLRWAEETDAVQKRYIGPSSLAALNAIRAGTSVEHAGRNGTTCGGIMRTPAAVLWREHASEGELAHDIFQCLLCTHNTSEALEAAGAYGFALHAALHGAKHGEILSAAIRGGAKLMAFAPEMHCAPSSAERIRFMDRYAAACSPEQLLDDVYAVFGTGLPSADVCGAVFAIFFSAQYDVWKAIQMGASIGGDTDTIAALAGALCCAYAGCSNIPPEVEDAVFRHNPILHGDPWMQHDEPV